MASPSTPSKPSTHAYAIVSTSSALLSRSNSSNSSLNRHSFSPAHDYQRHRHSKSLNSSDASLPTPPSSVRVRPFRSRSATDTDSSGHSDTGGEFTDWDPATDPVLYDLRNKLLPGTLEEWSPAQLAACLRSRGKERLGQLVIEHQVAGSDFTRLNHYPEYTSDTLSDLSPEDIDQLALECRKLRLLLRARRDFRSRNSSFSQSEESGPEDGFTPKTMSRIRVKRMVAAFESAPSSPAISSFESIPFPALDPQGAFTADSTPRKHPETSSSSDGVMSLQDSQSASGTDSQQGTFVKPEALNAEEQPMSVLLQSYAQDDATVFGAEAWERDLIGATARKFRSVEDAKSTEEDPEAVKSKLSGLFIPESTDHFSSPNEFTETPSLDTSDTSPAGPESDIVQELRNRVTELEEKLKSIESQNANSASVSTSPGEPEGYDVPQYLVMAGVGICAIMGQSILKRLFWSQA